MASRPSLEEKMKCPSVFTDSAAKSADRAEQRPYFPAFFPSGEARSARFNHSFRA